MTLTIQHADSRALLVRARDLLADEEVGEPAWFGDRDELVDELTDAIESERLPWWSLTRFRLGPRVWGLSGSWLAVCPWNGDTFWVTLPFVYFGAGTKNVELGLGKGRWHLSIDVRWRWE